MNRFCQILFLLLLPLTILADNCPLVRIEAERLPDLNIPRKAQGHNFVGTPVNVTQDGNTHVVLDDYATVSFKIPDDFPKEQYGELVGVLIGDEGTEYLFPDYAA